MIQRFIDFSKPIGHRLRASFSASPVLSLSGRVEHPLDVPIECRSMPIRACIRSRRRPSEVDRIAYAAFSAVLSSFDAP
jgi:hypothetical protein